MAVRGRQGNASSEEKPRAPRFVPEVGRPYVTLVNHQTHTMSLCPVDDWEKMKAADGASRFGAKKCSHCNGEVIQTCVGFGPPADRPIWIETCPHLKRSTEPKGEEHGKEEDGK